MVYKVKSAAYIQGGSKKKLESKPQTFPRVYSKKYSNKDRCSVDGSRVLAGLTKKDLPRGRWRSLTELEIKFLKMISLESDAKLTQREKRVKALKIIFLIRNTNV